MTCVVVGQADAQAPPAQLPPAAEPDVRLETLEPAVPERPPPPAVVPRTAPSRAPVGAERVRFVLTDLDVEGVEAYPPQFLERLHEDLLGTEITLAKVYDIAAGLEQAYRADGYFLSRVIVPPQEVRDGVVRLRVLEGFVSDVQYQGDIGPAQRLVETYLRDIPRERPLRLQTLERGLLLANDIPGVGVIGVLRPAPGEDQPPGAAELVVNVERKPFDAVAVLDNYGDDFTGTWELAAGVSANAFTSFGERVGVVGLVTDPFEGFTDNERVVQLGVSFRPPGFDGLYVDALASYSDSDPGSTLEEFDFDSDSLFVGILGGYPIVRSRNFNLAAELGFDFVNADTDIFGDDEFSSDRLRVLHLTGLVDWRDRRRGLNLARLGLRQGLPILGASESADDALSRADGTGVFTLLRAAVSRLQAITNELALFASVAGQFSFSDLLSDEEFEIGGTRFGRGYDFAELSSDHGVGFTAEAQYTRRPGYRYLDRYQPFAFYDFGQVWNRGGDSRQYSLSSVGAGARVWPQPSLSLELQIAQPLTRDSQRAGGDRSPQVLFRAVSRF